VRARQHALAAVVFWAAAVVPLATVAAEPLSLPKLRTTDVTVSGISSGGFMAAQLQVAYAATVSGAGIIAAGPYGCAGDNYPWNLWRATNVCSDFADGLPFAGPPPLAPSLDAVRRAAAQGLIDNPAGLAADRVYLFSGSRDRTVPPAVMEVTAAFYRALLADPVQQVSFETAIPAAHAMITLDFGNACDVAKPPYLSDCDYSAAENLLAHLYGPLAPAVAPHDDGLIAFDQREFLAPPPSASGLGDVGYLYLPRGCEVPGAGCRLHIVLHGCEQSREQIGDTFARHAGYNGVAEANRIVVLYPQARPVTMAWFGVTLPWPNPKGCWDWWGFTGRGYATREGVQPRAIKAMIDRLAGP
jgi:poly(3-hydroxybutyrate) depolymerase